MSRQLRNVRTNQLQVAVLKPAMQVLALLAGTALTGACGTPGAPTAPSLKLPNPVTDLTATRAGDEVTLHWTMSKRSTDKLILEGPQRAEVLRTLPSGSPGATPAVIASRTFDPGTAVTYTDKLPAELGSGPLRLLSYTVKLENHLSQSAGSSNVAFSAAGVPPAPVSGLAATMRPEGVQLHWTTAARDQVRAAGDRVVVTSGPESTQAGVGPVEAPVLIRLHRRLESGGQGTVAVGTVPPAKKSGSMNPAESEAEPREQTLLVKPSTMPENAATAGTAWDKSASFDRKYSYVAERVFVVAAEGHTVEVAGVASSPVEVDTRDVFPPRAPEGLAGIGVPDQGAIDLSWTPNTEADLAGYAAYRREGQGAWARISPPTPLLAPEFRDSAVEHSHSYTYAVTAIDHSGNESERSAVDTETLP